LARRGHSGRCGTCSAPEQFRCASIRLNRSRRRVLPRAARYGRSRPFVFLGEVGIFCSSDGALRVRLTQPVDSTRPSPGTSRTQPTRHCGRRRPRLRGQCRPVQIFSRGGSDWWHGFCAAGRFSSS
jgi:hypothetical protein